MYTLQTSIEPGKHVQISTMPSSTVAFKTTQAQLAKLAIPRASPPVGLLTHTTHGLGRPAHAAAQPAHNDGLAAGPQHLEDAAEGEANGRKRRAKK